MKIVEQYVFDNEDRRLLSIEIPDDPCNKCQINSGCLGCCDETEYCNFIKPYKDRNIYDLALKIKRMHKLQKDIINMQKEIDNIEYSTYYYIAKDRILFYGYLKDNLNEPLVNFKYFVNQKELKCKLGNCENYQSEIDYILAEYQTISSIL